MYSYDPPRSATNRDKSRRTSTIHYRYDPPRSATNRDDPRWIETNLNDSFATIRHEPGRTGTNRDERARTGTNRHDPEMTTKKYLQKKYVPVYP
jgi:hypothetical protein